MDRYATTPAPHAKAPTMVAEDRPHTAAPTTALDLQESMSTVCCLSQASPPLYRLEIPTLASTNCVTSTSESLISGYLSLTSIAKEYADLKLSRTYSALSTYFPRDSSKLSEFLNSSSISLALKFKLLTSGLPSCSSKSSMLLMYSENKGSSEISEY